MAPLAVAVSRLLGAPIWLQVHGIEAWTAPTRVARACTERARLVTSVSRYSRSRLLQWSAFDPVSVKVLPCVVEPRFAPGPKSQALLSRYGSNGRKVILTVSRLAITERYKGHDRVIKAMPRVLQSEPAALYIAFGDGDDRSRLAALAQELGVAEAVCLPGPAAEEELPEIYRMADVFVMPSTGEGFGIVYLEAAASGIPVIAGNRDGSVDALADGALGTLVDPLDNQQLADAILASLKSPVHHDRAEIDRFSHANFSRQVDALVQFIQ